MEANLPNRTLAGIWIDLKKAVVVELKKEQSSITIHESDIISRERNPGDSDHSGRFGLQHVHEEKHKENRLLQEKKKFLKHLVDELKDYHQIVIFGPAGMKKELKKEIQKHHELDRTPVETKSADAMTDNQIIAWVKKYYSAI